MGAQKPAECERANRAGQRVGRDRETNEDAQLSGWRDLDCEPGDGDGAHPVAERRYAESSHEPPRPAVSQQPLVDGRDHKPNLEINPLGRPRAGRVAQWTRGWGIASTLLMDAFWHKSLSRDIEG
jgi:hypothetical protein